jgi:uncharacterized protein with ATP-grasp and redox domains
MDYRCYSCLAKAYTKLLEEHNLSADERERQTKAFLSFMANAENGLIAPEIARRNQHQIKKLLGLEDPYKEIKIRSNQYLLDKYSYFKELINRAKDPFDIAIRLAISGNIIDYAANPDFDLEGTITKVLKEDFAINHSEELKSKLKTAKTVLYMGDNAGEIVMDKLFLEHINHPNVYYSVRNAPVINDVTFEDAKQTGIDKYAKVISNGYDAPSTILNKCSQEFLDIYDKADVIISKGQGNLEGLLNEKNPKLFFLLMVKCEMIAEKFNVKKGDFVVSKRNH